MFARTVNPFRTTSQAKPKRRREPTPRNQDPLKARTEWAAVFSDIELIKAENANVQLPGTWTVEDYNQFTFCLTALLERDSEAINLYTPLEKGDHFHRCMMHEIGLSGSNRAGKTTTAAAEVAMCALGVHYIRDKYPTEGGCQIAAIGNDGRHLSLMYEYLFEKAPFKVFQNPLTYAWKVVLEDDQYCQKFQHLWQDAQPMIPPRMVRQISWENKKEKIPKSVRLHNGTVIRFYSGLVRKLPQGRKFHLVWMDEEVDQPGRWIDEMRARIVDYNGRIFWSATPQRASQEFFDMELKAADPENETKPMSEQTAFFIMQSLDNIYLSKVGNQAFMAKMKDNDEQLRTRFFGQSGRSFLSAYPEFGDHNLINDFNLQHDDTRYIIIDPGVDVAAVLFLAAPGQADEKLLAKLSDEEKKYRTRTDCLVCYDELYIRQANPEMVAEAIKQKLATYPTSWIQDFTIDQKGGKSMIWRGMRKEDTCESLYMDAIKKYDITSRQGHRWYYGSSDVKYGVEKTKGLLIKDFDQMPRFFVHRRCKKLVWEFKAWKKKRNPNGEFIGYEELNNHLLDCVRYATTRELAWVPPPVQSNIKDFTAADLKKAMQRIKTGEYKQH